MLLIKTKQEFLALWFSSDTMLFKDSMRIPGGQYRHGAMAPKSNTKVASRAIHRVDESDALQKSVEQQHTSPNSPPLKQFISSCCCRPER
ncbi:unnamed protein product [Nippostrongylus brasiliensis]|uniref:Uncharacterized protein n=1 Tax=Nippostrongylus brasiliensis TaxID=27835 RepID=A0A0N4YQW1_NIPBR|nr:unnamed protein product [Nippostrongylus brasiliensis]